MLRNDAVLPLMPPGRDTMPTLPCDLAEYAWRETGPRSWSAFPEADLEESLDEGVMLDDPFDTLFDDEDLFAT